MTLTISTSTQTWLKTTTALLFMDVAPPCCTPLTLSLQLVVRHGDGSTDWESGDNRSVQLPPGPAVVTCTWGDASRTLVDEEVRGRHGQGWFMVLLLVPSSGGAHRIPAMPIHCSLLHPRLRSKRGQELKKRERPVRARQRVM